MANPHFTRTRKKQKNILFGMERLIYSRVILFCVGLCSANFADAQNIGEIEQNARKLFPDQSAVFLERSMTLNLVIEGDSLKAYTDVVEDILHLKNQTNDYASKKVYGSQFNEVKNIKAKTLVWDKSRYKEIPVTDYKKSSDIEDNIFYDDSYFYSFNYPVVASGNRTQLQYKQVQKEIRFLSGYIFTSYIPHVKANYTIKASKDVEIQYEVFNDPGNTIKFQKVEKGNNVTYEWTAENVEELRVEEGSPSIRYYAPHVVCYVKSYKGKSAVHEVLPDVKGLYRWYYSLIRGEVDETPSEEVASVVKAIKSKYSREEDIVREVFYWVQDNIRYIAFEDGMRGFIPHKASYTCEKKYGDCKDMANLIVGMLHAADIKAYPTWIGTRNLPYKYSSVPTPLSDDHMIATYISSSGDHYFLDATGPYTTFGYPTAMIQGKQAMISKGPDLFEIHQVPAVEKNRNRITDSLTLTLDQNMLIGKGVNSINGLTKAQAGSYLDRVDEKDIRDFVLGLVGKGSNKFFLDHYELKDWKVRDKPTRVTYDFRIGDYCQKVGDELYINLNLNKENNNRVINRDLRKTPHEFDFKYDKVQEIEFTIPKGYEIDYLPATESFAGEMSGYSVTYRVEGNKIYCSTIYYIDYLLMSVEQFEIWNREIKKISAMYQETVILKKKA
jgi:transglutaminase-like putative cysteine protease